MLLVFLLSCYGFVRVASPDTKSAAKAFLARHITSVFFILVLSLAAFVAAVLFGPITIVSP